MNILAFWHCFGTHAGESPEDILTRKRHEIRANSGWTLWSFAGRTEATLLTWSAQIRSLTPDRVIVLCSHSKNAVDPKGTPAYASGFRRAASQNWEPIPNSIEVPHPFGKRHTASAFWVSDVFGPKGVPSRCEWFCIGERTWRADSVPTRGEYLLRSGPGTPLRPVSAILELRAPFVVQIRRT